MNENKNVTDVIVIDKKEFENFIKESERLRYVRSILSDEDSDYVRKKELLRACGIITEKEI